MSEARLKDFNSERRKDSCLRHNAKSPDSVFSTYQLADWKRDLRKPSSEASQLPFSSRNSVPTTTSSLLAQASPSSNSSVNNLQRVFLIRDDNNHHELKSSLGTSTGFSQPTKSLKLLRDGYQKKQMESSSNSIFDQPRRCIKVTGACVTEGSPSSLLEEKTTSKKTDTTMTPESDHDASQPKQIQTKRAVGFSSKEAFTRTTETHYAKHAHKKVHHTNPGLRVLKSTNGQITQQASADDGSNTTTSKFSGVLEDNDKENVPVAGKPSKIQACLRDITLTAGTKPTDVRKKAADPHARSNSLPLESKEVSPVPPVCKPLAHILPPPFKDFSVVTDVGISRDYNEDKVCVIQRFSREDDQQATNPCGFFGLYDGHGGSGCANYLRDNFYTVLAGNQHFKSNKMRAIEESFSRMEAKFEAKSIKESDFSGSCALVALVEFNRVTLGNVGDSRMLLCSGSDGTRALTTDHKPENTRERERIQRAGGKVYRTKTETTFESIDSEGKLHISRKEAQQGPFRVEPGGLSVSRTIGDVKVKQFTYGGHPGCIIAEPEIREVTLTDSAEFLILACDGIFDVMESVEVTKIARDSLKISASRKYEARAACKQACLEIIEAAKTKRSRDNLTVILVTMKDITYFASAN